MDVLARLIVDGMDGYENFTPEGLKTGNGDLYLEITPITFNVRVKAGISLSQLRFFYAEPRLSEMRGEELYKTLLRQSKKNDGTLSVDLSPTKINDHEVAAFCANEMDEKGEPIDLWKTSQDSEKPDPCKFWKFLKANENERLKIEKGAFYILRSKERIQLPKGVAVYCRAIDETIGEMRIHYAGFVHPFFGTNRKDSLIGTPLIFEVRGHDLNVNLVDEEKMARLTFYRMSEDADDGDSSTAYNEQVLQLSTFFRDWPNKISVDASGNVTPRE